MLKANWESEVERFSKELPTLLVQDRAKIDGHPLARGTRNTYRGDSFLRNAIDRDLQLQGMEMMFYPSVVQLWEEMPRVLQLGPRAVQAFDEGENFLGTPLGQLERLFPCCLLLDVRPLQWTLFDEELDHVFVYPVYDDKTDSVLLYYVGAGPKGWALAIESKLILNGENFDTARAFSEAEHRRAWILQLGGMGTCVDAPFYFDPFLDEQEFGAVVDNIIAMAVSDRTTLAPTEEDGVEVLTALLDYVPEEEPEEGPEEEPAAGAVAEGDEGECGTEEAGRGQSQADCGAAAMMANAGVDAPAGAVGASGSLGAAAAAGVSGASGAAAGPDVSELPETAMEGAAGEPVVKGLLADGRPQEDPRLEEAWLENLRLQEELDKVREGYDKAISEANFKLASTLHRTRTLELEAEALRQQNSSLAGRSALLERLRLPQTPAEALELAADAFPDRLLLLPPARKSAEAFTHGSTAEVWEVLRSMAVVLHPLIFGQEGGHVAKRFQDQTGFELTLRDMKVNKRNQAFARLRTVEYNGTVHDMTAHVKGRSNKLGETLRVHFFADYEQNRLVIGHCGEHLPTAKTNSL